jgi:hypothetical protein
MGTSRKIQQSEFDHPNFPAIPGEISNGEGAKDLIDKTVVRFGKIDVLAHTRGWFRGWQIAG